MDGYAWKYAAMLLSDVSPNKHWICTISVTTGKRLTTVLKDEKGGHSEHLIVKPPWRVVELCSFSRYIRKIKSFVKYYKTSNKVHMLCLKLLT